MGRQAVRLGEDHVVGNRGGAHVRKRGGEVGQPVTTPGPLSEPGQGPFVDIDDAHRVLADGARPQTLITVESDQADGGDKARVDGAQNRNGDKEKARDGDDRQPFSTGDPHARFPALSPARSAGL